MRSLDTDNNIINMFGVFLASLSQLFGGHIQLNHDLS